ncbi:MAG: HEAT repeat domain-containing protein, partial [Myxococcales bacterium]|nr:HEAT repeat domain-containing protein [Myxococcales bacterium]
MSYPRSVHGAPAPCPDRGLPPKREEDSPGPPADLPPGSPPGSVLAERGNHPPGPPADLSPGSVLAERYEILERLGEGGMGAVYRARHLLLDTPMAIKVLLRPTDADAQARFLQEARLASRVNHQNTVTIHDFGLLEDGRLFLVMEHLDGPTLTNVVAGRPVGLLRSLRIAAQIARGLQAVHDKGIVHRDLKPDNIFLLRAGTPQEFVKIVDFGIARLAHHPVAQATAPEGALPAPVPTHQGRRLTLPGRILGTPHYMAPEQARGEEVDARADQYALGCILYEMLTGRVPFDHPDSLSAVLLQHLNAPVPSLSQHGQEPFPASIDALVQRLLAKDPAQRFGSMAEVDQALSAEIERLEGPRSRRRTALVLVQTVLLLGIALYLGHRALRPGQTEVTTAQLLELRRRALQVLHDDARASDPGVRLPAIAALGESRDPAQRPPLEGFLLDPGLPVRVQAAEALGKLGDRQAAPALKRAEEQASSPVLLVTLAGARYQLGEASAREVLWRALTDPEPEVRHRAAIQLCERGDAEGRGLLLRLAAQPGLADEVLAGLLVHLVRCGEAAALQRLQALFAASQNRQKQIFYAARLLQAGDERGRAFLRELAGRPGPDQLPAARLLSAPDTPELAPLFRRVLGDRSSTSAARLLALEGLGLCGQRQDAPLLAASLEARQDVAQRQAAALAILRIGLAEPGLLSEQSLALVRNALDDPSSELRSAAALVLGDVPAEGAVVLLAGLLRDAEARVRLSAARALGRRHEQAALEALRGALDDEDDQVRQEALRSLRRIGQTLRQRGAGGLDQQVAPWVQTLQQQGTAREQVLATALLLELGDETQRDRLRAFRTTQDEQARRLLVEEAEGDVELLAGFLSDPAFQVRLAAAQRLAERGDRRALPVLREALEKEGEEALRAHALLARLGESSPEPMALRLPLSSLPEGQRLAVVSAARQLPLPVALDRLRQAARDPSVQVRLAVAEAAAGLPPGPNGPPGRPLLRLLAGDGDPLVRARAQMLLLSLSGSSLPEQALRPLAPRKEPPPALHPPPPKAPAE